MPHIRQSRPDYGVGVQVKAYRIVRGVPSSLGSGKRPNDGRATPQSGDLEHNETVTAMIWPCFWPFSGESQHHTVGYAGFVPLKSAGHVTNFEAQKA